MGVNQISTSKELYIAEVERITAGLEALGCPSELAYEIASERAYDSMRDRLADYADNLRKRAKGE